MNLCMSTLHVVHLLLHAVDECICSLWNDKMTTAMQPLTKLLWTLVITVAAVKTLWERRRPWRWQCLDAALWAACWFHAVMWSESLLSPSPSEPLQCHDLLYTHTQSSKPHRQSHRQTEIVTQAVTHKDRHRYKQPNTDREMSQAAIHIKTETESKTVTSSHTERQTWHSNSLYLPLHTKRSLLRDGTSLRHNKSQYQDILAKWLRFQDSFKFQDNFRTTYQFKGNSEPLGPQGY